MVFNLLKDRNIEVVENHHIYLSTILEEVVDKRYPHDEKKKGVEEEHKRGVGELIKKFKKFIESIFSHH